MCETSENHAILNIYIYIYLQSKFNHCSSENWLQNQYGGIIHTTSKAYAFFCIWFYILFSRIDHFNFKWLLLPFSLSFFILFMFRISSAIVRKNESAAYFNVVLIKTDMAIHRIAVSNVIPAHLHFIRLPGPREMGFYNEQQRTIGYSAKIIV